VLDLPSPHVIVHVQGASFNPRSVKEPSKATLPPTGMLVDVVARKVTTGAAFFTFKAF
jgi:hypothetical protein